MVPRRRICADSDPCLRRMCIHFALFSPSGKPFVETLRDLREPLNIAFVSQRLIASCWNTAYCSDAPENRLQKGLILVPTAEEERAALKSSFRCSGEPTNEPAQLRIDLWRLTISPPRNHRAVL
ncbi:hypothetical protein CGCVW01_v005904 [Colletotrichum viniferum]|nr:hypothetical protein CGCVW01_v005904 [Colletotrichum viniferum]